MQAPIFGFTLYRCRAKSLILQLDPEVNSYISINKKLSTYLSRSQYSVESSKGGKRYVDESGI